MVKIVVFRYGNVENGFAGKVLEIMNDCYNRINSHGVAIVDLYLFDKSSTMNAFLSEEKRSLGIATSPFESSFFAIHDAWHGTPRIMIAYDRMSALPELVRVGGLRHEVAHTVLHGSLEYYSLLFPSSLLKLERKGIISRQIMVDLLYLVSVAVKDYEVTRLLYEKGFVEDQVGYNRYFLQSSEDDREAWKIAKEDRTAKLFVLASLLKTSCCAVPLQKDERYGEEIAESISKSLSYLPANLSRRLLKILEVSPKFAENTQENVDLLVRKVVDELIIKQDAYAEKKG